MRHLRPITPPSSPLFWCLLSLIAGISIGEGTFFWLSQWGASHLLLWALAAVATAWAALLLAHRGRTVGGALPLLLLGIAALGAALLVGERQSQRVEWPADPITRHPVAQTYRAIVSTSPRPTAQGQRLRIRLLDAPFADRLVEITLLGQHDSLRIGDGLVVHAAVQSPEVRPNPGEMDYGAYLRRQNVVGTAVAFDRQWRKMPTTASLTLAERALRLRDHLVAQYAQHLPQRDLGLLAAMSLGDKRWLDAETRQLFSETGASHVLALSGLHLAIVFGCYQWLVVALARRRSHTAGRIAELLGLALVWGFTLLAGFPTSLVRAALMFSIAQTINLFAPGRNSFHSLIVAALIMLLFAPSWLFDVGFQLSCMAVMGILWLQPLLRMPAWLDPPNYLPEHQPRTRLGLFSRRILLPLLRSIVALLFVSLAAQIATAPLVAHYFHLLPLSGLLSSLIVIPLAHVVLLGSVAFFALPPAQPAIGQALSATLHFMESGLQQLTALPYATLPFSLDIPALLLVLLALALWAKCCYARPSRQRLLLWIAGCGLWLLASIAQLLTAHLARPTAAHVRIYRTHRTTALHLIAPSRPTLLLTTTAQLPPSALHAAQLDWSRRQLPVAQRPLNALRHTAVCDSLMRQHPPFGLAPHIVVLGSERLAVVDSRLSSAFPREPLPVGALLVAGSSRQPLAHLLRYYRPRQLLLAAELPLAHRRRIAAQALAMRLPVVDIDRQGWVEWPAAHH